MTPKQKAEELYCNYMKILNIVDLQIIANPFAKQCSLIAVDEIINNLNYGIRDLDVRGNIFLDLIKFWREVKQELENK